MSSPIVSILPNIPLSPFSKILLLSANFYPAQSGQYILPQPIKKPGYGKLVITVAVGAAGTVGLSWGTAFTFLYYALNNGSALNANTLYVFEIPDDAVPPDVPINFIWYSSSSSTTSTWITLQVVYVPG